MENVVVAWDDNVFADRIREEAEPEVSVATSRKSFDRLRIEKKDPSLIILLELSWQGRRTDFHGFEVLKDLLMEDADSPLLLCSFLEREQFYSLEGVNRFLARMPFPFERLPSIPATLLERVRGIDTPHLLPIASEAYFEQEDEEGELDLKELPDLPSQKVGKLPHLTAPEAFLEKLRGVRPLSARMRAYIRENYLAQEPVSDVVHDLRTVLETELEEGEFRDTVARLTRDLNALNINLPQEISDQNRTVRRQALRKEEDNTDLRESTEVLKDQLNRLDFSRRSSGQNQEPFRSAYNYHVLIVEDDDSQREEYRKGLEPYFDDVRAVGTADQALEELRSSDEYRAVVADWRLLEDDGVTWQRLQGFDLLIKAWESSAPIHLVALTSLNREAVASVLRETNVDIDWFPKSEVGKDARWPYHALAEYIHKRIEPALQDLEDIPDFTWWTEKGLGDRFLELKYKSKRWDQVRSNVKKAAEKVIENIEDGDGLGEDEKINNKKYYEGKHALTAPSSGTEEASMRQLEKILPQRMIVLAMCFAEKEIKSDVVDRATYGAPITKILFKKLRGTKKNVGELDESRVRQWFSKIGISYEKGEIKKSAFDYEKKWINEKFGVVFNVGRVYREEIKDRVLEMKFNYEGKDFRPDTALEATKEIRELSLKGEKNILSDIKEILKDRKMRIIIDEYGYLEEIKAGVDAADPETSSERLRTLADNHPEAVAGNPEAPKDLLASLAGDEYGDEVHEALVDNPSTPDEVLPKLFEPDDPG
jgi:CheY-like chemotaxis protein